MTVNFATLRNNRDIMEVLQHPPPPQTPWSDLQP